MRNDLSHQRSFFIKIISHMAFKKFEEGLRKKMHDVSSMNIKCKDCNADIAELPFQPDPNRLDSLRCRDCMKKYRESRPRRF